MEQVILPTTHVNNLSVVLQYAVSFPHVIYEIPFKAVPPLINSHSFTHLLATDSFALIPHLLKSLKIKCMVSCNCGHRGTYGK